MPLFGSSNPVITGLENMVLGELLPENISVTVKNPATNPLPIFFSAWQNLIHDLTDGPASGMNFSFPADYYTTMQIVTFDKQDNASLVYVFDKVYPVVVESVALDWSAQDSFTKLTVSFLYSNWRVIKANPSKLSIGVNVNLPFGGGTLTF